METDSDPIRNLGEQLDELLYRWDELRRRPAVIAVAVAAVAVLLGMAWAFTRDGAAEPAVPIEDRIPVVSLAPTRAPTTERPFAVVHVTGAVRQPGVYELDVGARVFDALEMAGGATSEGQTDRLNLAAPVQDGMQIRVPIEGEAAAVVAPLPGPTVGPINLNTASAAELESLPGVGPATASAIISYRDEVGGFGSVSDLLGVRGIGEAKLAALEGLVMIG